MKRIHIKICGITQIKQATAISQLGVDALGFILYPGSPRYIPPLQIRGIINTLPPFLKTVGVFVNEPVDSMVDIMQQSGLDLAQLSGDESVTTCQQLTEKGINWIPTIRIRGAKDLDAVDFYPGRHILLDAWSKDAYGGTGKAFDWQTLDRVQDRSKIILAGGINAENVQNAIKTVRPYGLDVSSGVEESPGVKSLDKIKALLENIITA